MLVVLNLDWAAYDIHAKVMQAAEKLNQEIKSKSAGHYVQFNLASTGGGEKIFFKSTPEDKRLPTDVMDELRQHHARAVQSLRQESSYNNYQDMAQTLVALRRLGVTLAAVYHGDDKDVDHILKNAHLRDYFEEHVYATGHYGQRVDIDHHFYSLVMDATESEPRETLVVDTTLDGVQAGHYAGGSVLAYIPPVKSELPPLFKAMEDLMARIGLTPERLITNTQDIQTAASVMANYTAKRPKPTLAIV